MTVVTLSLNSAARMTPVAKRSVAALSGAPAAQWGSAGVRKERKAVAGLVEDGVASTTGGEEPEVCVGVRFDPGDLFDAVFGGDGGAGQLDALFAAVPITNEGVAAEIASHAANENTGCRHQGEHNARPGWRPQAPNSMRCHRILDIVSTTVQRVQMTDVSSTESCVNGHDFHHLRFRANTIRPSTNTNPTLVRVPFGPTVSVSRSFYIRKVNAVRPIAPSKSATVFGAVDGVEQRAAGRRSFPRTQNMREN